MKKEIACGLNSPLPQEERERKEDGRLPLGITGAATENSPFSPARRKGIGLPFARRHDIEMRVEDNRRSVGLPANQTLKIGGIAIRLTRQWKRVIRILHDRVVNRHQRTGINPWRDLFAEETHCRSFVSAGGRKPDQFHQQGFDLVPYFSRSRHPHSSRD